MNNEDQLGLTDPTKLRIRYSFGEDSLPDEELEEEDILDELESEKIKSSQSKYLNQFKEQLIPNTEIHTEVFTSREEYTSSHLLSDNSYFNKNRGLGALQSYDIIITHGWDGNAYGPTSALFDAFELWYMVQWNTLPSDLGGLKIALLFPDCPGRQDQIKILDAIFNKYNIDVKMFRYLCQHIYFIDQPKEMILSKGITPYKNYSPSNIVFVDGKLPDVPLQADNIYLSLIGGLREEELIMASYNYLMLYIDKRILSVNEQYQKEGLGKDIKIARSTYPNTLIFDDIRRIDFSLFKKPLPKKKETNSTEKPKKKFLMYLTPKNRTPKWIKNDINTIKEIDDVLNSIPDAYINNIGLEVRAKQKELYQYFKESNKIPDTNPKNPKYNNFSEDQLEAIRNKGEIFGNGYTIDDVICQDPKAHLILVGLDSVTQEFESMLLARAFKKGINISTEVYLQKDLPIKNIHEKYDIYLFTPAYKWTSSRFIPEALNAGKKIIYTKMAIKSMYWNYPLLIRMNDAKNYLSFISEDDTFKKPKSKLARHLLGNWN